jgi:hypothetical protein
MLAVGYQQQCWLWVINNNAGCGLSAIMLAVGYQQ